MLPTTYYASSYLYPTAYTYPTSYVYPTTYAAASYDLTPTSYLAPAYALRRSFLFPRAGRRPVYTTALSYTPTAYYTPTVYTPTVYSPTVYTPTVYSPTVYTPTVYSPTVYSPTVYTTSYTPTVMDYPVIASSNPCPEATTVTTVLAPQPALRAPARPEIDERGPAASVEGVPSNVPPYDSPNPSPPTGGYAPRTGSGAPPQQAPRPDSGESPPAAPPYTVPPEPKQGAAGEPNKEVSTIPPPAAAAPPLEPGPTSLRREVKKPVNTMTGGLAGASPTFSKAGFDRARPARLRKGFASPSRAASAISRVGLRRPMLTAATLCGFPMATGRSTSRCRAAASTRSARSQLPAVKLSTTSAGRSPA